MEEKFKHRVSNHLSVELLLDDFKRHLDISDNLRIFFSAKFGSGKTYFLQEFFDSYSSEYEIIRLFPINYTTANNKDIFELIKFDILFHLLRFHEDKIDKIAISDFLKAQWYLHGKINSLDLKFNFEILSSLLDIETLKSNFPIWVNSLSVLQKVFNTAKAGYDDFVSKMKKDDLDLTDSFLEQIMKNSAEYGELDPITGIIKKTIQCIQNEGRQVILLIDDLDRLDPDHLFRLLNIFGNHLSLSSGNKILYVNENKFGFDKIILVGDIRNVNSIYAHRYGVSADFEGYFSKYYSKCVYNFEIKNILLKRDNYSGRLDLSTRSIFIDNFFPRFRNSYNQEHTLVRYLLETLFIFLIDENQISFRSIRQKTGISFQNGNPQITSSSLHSSAIYYVTRYFIWFFDSKENFINAISNCQDFPINKLDALGNSNYKLLFHELLKFSVQNLKSHQDFENLKKRKDYHNVQTKILGSDKECTVHFQMSFNSFEFDIKDLKYLEENNKEIYPTPEISFKNMYISFIKTYM